MEQELKKYNTVEAQYKAMAKFIKTVKNSLIKSDIARILANYWNKDLAEIKEYLNVSHKDNIEEMLAEFKDIYAGIGEMETRITKQSGIFTGFESFDESTGGLNYCDVFFIGARPGIGKTQFGMEIALNMAIKQNKNVLFFSLEMPAGQIYLRIVAHLLKISTRELRRRVREKEIDYAGAVDKISKKFKVIDKSGLTLDQIEDRIKLANSMCVFDGNVDVVVIDYLQLVNGMDDFSDFEAKVKYLNPMAKNNNVLTIVLSQMNRTVKPWEEPDISQMKGGGSIEAVANFCILLWKKNENPSASKLENRGQDIISCKIGKARDGCRKRFFSILYDEDESGLKEYFE